MSSRDQQESALLGALFSARGHWLSRRELAGAAEVPPGDLERRLASYLEAGYPIQFHPQGKVILQEPPDIWCAEEIMGRCPGGGNIPFWDPLLLAETSST